MESLPSAPTATTMTSVQAQADPNETIPTVSTSGATLASFKSTSGIVLPTSTPVSRSSSRLRDQEEGRPRSASVTQTQSKTKSTTGMLSYSVTKITTYHFLRRILDPDDVGQTLCSPGLSIEHKQEFAFSKAPQSFS